MSIPSLKNYAANIDPHENKPDWTLDNDRAVVLVHDMQSYFVNFFEPNHQALDNAIANMATILTQARAQKVPVIYTAQPAKQDAKHRGLLTDFWGEGLKEEADTQIVPALAPEPQEPVFTKWRYSALQRTDLKDWLHQQGRDQMVIVGIYAHIGIMATSLDAFMNDIQTFVVADAVADFNHDNHVQGLDFVAKRCGVVVDSNYVQTQLAPPTALSIDEVHQQVIELLDLSAEEVSISDNLIFAGLDSVRLMTLLGQWRAMGINIELAEIAPLTSIQQWYQAFESRFNQARSVPA